MRVADSAIDGCGHGGASSDLPTGVRAGLRDGTRGLHRRVDRLFGALDLTDRRDYGHFLRAHAAALATLDRVLTRQPPASGRPPALLPFLRDDLAALGLAAPPPLQLGPLPPIDTDGVAYVLAGAHFGNAVLRRRWAAAADPAVLAAGSYLGCDCMRAFWPGFLARLEARRLRDTGLKPLLAGARLTFACFQAAFAATAPAPRESAGE